MLGGSVSFDRALSAEIIPAWYMRPACSIARHLLGLSPALSDAFSFVSAFFVFGDMRMISMRH